MTQRGSRFPTNMSDINWIFSVRMYRYAWYPTFILFVAMKITVFDGSSKPFSSCVLGTFNWMIFAGAKLILKTYAVSRKQSSQSIFIEVAGRSTAREVEELQAIFILAGDGEAVVKSLCLYCLMVEARLWRLVLEIEWLNCFPSVSLWANCMYSPIRSIYIRLFEPSDCIALLLTNVLTCNTVPFALCFSSLWSIQSCVMLFKEFIYPHNLSFEPISVPFISAWDCVLKLFTEK